MAFGIDDAISAVSSLGETIVKTIWTNPSDAANAQETIIKAHVDAVSQQLQAAQAVMLAEEQSADPWTSRARPSFLWVCYILLLWSLPMSFIFAFAPETGGKIVFGFQAWLSAIPNSIVNLFETVMLGYTAGRTIDKAVPHVTKIWK
jgi:hypothetical protein